MKHGCVSVATPAKHLQFQSLKLRQGVRSRSRDRQRLSFIYRRAMSAMAEGPIKRSNMFRDAWQIIGSCVQKNFLSLAGGLLFDALVTKVPLGCTEWSCCWRREETSGNLTILNGWPRCLHGFRRADQDEVSRSGNQDFVHNCSSEEGFAVIARPLRKASCWSWASSIEHRDGGLMVRSVREDPDPEDDPTSNIQRPTSNIQHPVATSRISTKSLSSASEREGCGPLRSALLDGWECR